MWGHVIIFQIFGLAENILQLDILMFWMIGPDICYDKIWNETGVHVVYVTALNKQCKFTI